MVAILLACAAAHAAPRAAELGGREAGGGERRGGERRGERSSRREVNNT